jgi:hypothetical protein
MQEKLLFVLISECLLQCVTKARTATESRLSLSLSLSLIYLSNLILI